MTVSVMTVELTTSSECVEMTAGFESEGNARERRSRSFSIQRENGNVVPVVFFLYTGTPTVNSAIFHKSPSVIKLIRLLPAFMHVDNNDVTFTASSRDTGVW